MAKQLKTNCKNMNWSGNKYEGKEHTHVVGENTQEKKNIFNKRSTIKFIKNSVRISRCRK